jgi:AGZA family xanthine/uracil permease-like MFS transporter
VALIVLLGTFVGPAIRKHTPRAAMLGTLAGISVAFISIRPAYQILNGALIGLIYFMIILLNWVGNVRLPFGVPGGLAVVVGSVLAWGSVVLGMGAMMDSAGVAQSLQNFSLHLPGISDDVFS